MEPNPGQFQIQQNHHLTFFSLPEIIILKFFITVENKATTIFLKAVIKPAKVRQSSLARKFLSACLDHFRTCKMSKKK